MLFVTLSNRELQQYTRFRQIMLLVTRVYTGPANILNTSIVMRFYVQFWQKWKCVYSWTLIVKAIFIDNMTSTSEQKWVIV
jgi:hypothetical protein